MKAIITFIIVFGYFHVLTATDCQCSESMFSCGDSKCTCIPVALVCDKDYDCANKNDEKHCSRFRYPRRVYHDGIPTTTSEVEGSKI
ncbi:low-density lipoprotein receptor-related protein 4 [Octopus vulgaris]|uniref:Low-density lipoprotein receptor-related protein 4 n=1 Tax=Octopus vulgaris TaxID=6645 RepID=A0AA36F4U5_OCTVU|nr:low-density lipoprotein receptor-related protein 4 [Octopus vulgaris]